MESATWIVRPGPAICKALVAAQKAARSVAKDAENKFMHYRYASAEAIMAEGREALNGAGLALVGSGWTYEPWPKETGEALGACGAMRVEYLLVHDSGETAVFCSTVAVMPERSARTDGWARPLDKAQATALTYSAGYTLRGLLMLPRVADDEEADAPQRQPERTDRPDGRQREEANRKPVAPGPLQALQIAKTIGGDVGDVIERHFGAGVRDAKALSALTTEAMAGGMAKLNAEAADIKAAKAVGAEIAALAKELGMDSAAIRVMAGGKGAADLTMEALMVLRDDLSAKATARKDTAK